MPKTVRRIAIALAALALVLGPAVPASAATVCDKYCDQRDPALAAGDRTPVSATVYSRQIVLHISDADNMGWASIDNGDPTDEVWLDRSYDGGRSWSGGSKLGDTTIPDGRRGWRTLMYNVDDPANHGVGALRACGKAGNRSDIACTQWARSTVNAGTRVDAAATALMQYYNNGNGLWNTTGWWNSANALTAIIDYSQRTGSTAYRYAIANTFDKNKNAQGGNFTNDYMDDTGWWGLAWVRAYDLTGDSRYLNMARIDADYMYSFRDGTCGGGIWWRSQRDYKNAITNELFVKLAAALHDRISGDTNYLNKATEIWNWFNASGMINSGHLINDGLDSSCHNNGQTTWTYNQGVILGGLLELNKATGNAGYLTTARQIADAATTSSVIAPGGILREPCEPANCGGDGPSFKGVFVRNLGELSRATGNPYASFLQRQADSAYAHDRNPMDQYGLSWAGPYDSSDGARQHSAVDLMTAAP
ncbi:glycoside hydrolase family 76 protein [Fodinicola acaciae]|uniref:glycoside hydrolase family 76 protein n=1 Tax=Fodinicola acaciae TaxID=2681555 RepID=UPI0013D1093F|nr:glycoside hydrolase family 76 protein [Fodinicola acaciae]